MLNSSEFINLYCPSILQLKMTTAFDHMARFSLFYNHSNRNSNLYSWILLLENLFRIMVREGSSIKFSKCFWSVFPAYYHSQGSNNQLVPKFSIKFDQKVKGFRKKQFWPGKMSRPEFLPNWNDILRPWQNSAVLVLQRHSNTDWWSNKP